MLDPGHLAEIDRVVGWLSGLGIRRSAPARARFVADLLAIQSTLEPSATLASVAMAGLTEDQAEIAGMLASAGVRAVIRRIEGVPI